MSKPEFVTAQVLAVDGTDTRQGWLINSKIMVGESGVPYAVVDSVTTVSNPPKEMSYKAEATASYVHVTES